MRIFIAALALVLAAPTAAAAPAGHDLTLVFTDRTGAPAVRADATLTNLDTGENLSPDSTTGTATVTLAPGRYTLLANVYTGQSEASLLVRPMLDVTGPATVALDARLARLIEVRVPHRDARIAAAVAIAQVRYTAGGEPRATAGGLSTADAPVLSTAHLGPVRPGLDLRARIKVNLAAPNAATSPYHYALVFDQDSRMWTGLDREVRASELRSVRADYHSLAGATRGGTGTSVRSGGYDHTTTAPIVLPHRRTEYYTAGVEWDSTLCYDRTCLTGPPTERWNHGPFLPTARLIERMGDALRMVAGIADQEGHRGLDQSDLDGRYRLYRDGVLVGETPLDQPGFRDLPPEVGAYRLELSGAARTLLPGEFHAAWTFRSGYAEIGEGLLPALNVRFTPHLDERNHAPTGQPLELPIRVDGGEVRELRLAVSFDGGTVWRPTPVRRTPEGWTTRVMPPAGAADVSLRAHAVDRDENTVEVTVTRAVPLSRAGG